jgi:starch-binding outer membrane protein, SusD/RagB family
VDGASQHQLLTYTPFNEIKQMLDTYFARRRLTPTLLAVAVLVTGLVACNSDKFLKVTDPDVAVPQALAGVGALPALRAGAIGNFGAAFNGPADEEQIDLAALLSDEFINTETFPTRIEIDQRAQTVTNGSLHDTFFDLTRARASSEFAIRNFEALAKTADDSTGYPEMLSLNGQAYILFAENYCPSVPVSTQNADGSFTFGAGEATNTLLDSAINKASKALAIQSASLTNEFKFLAQVTKGRALLDKGDFAGAAAAVAGVPTTFQYNYQHSVTTTRQNNGDWALTVNVGRFGEANLEGGNGLPFQSDGDVQTNATPDPRVPDSVASRGGSKPDKGFDGSTVQFVQMKYPDRATPSTIADGVEARLIEAEATLHGGDPVGALNALNALRSNAALLALRGYPANSLPPLTLQVGATAQQDQLFKERAYWLFLTSHRLGDLRRLIRQYGRAANTVFPIGPYFKGGVYGTDVNSPVPQQEQNNPKYVPGSCKQDQA